MHQHQTEQMSQMLLHELLLQDNQYEVDNRQVVVDSQWWEAKKIILYH